MLNIFHISTDPCVSSFEKCLFWSFACCWIGLLAFLLWSYLCLYIFILTSYQIYWLAHIFFYPIGYLFTLLMFSWLCRIYYIYNVLAFVILAFVACTLGIRSKKFHFPGQCHILLPQIFFQKFYCFKSYI
jgi:hypothetical protein